MQRWIRGSTAAVGRTAFVEGSGGGRLWASGPGGSTKWDLAVLGDGAARPEWHRLR